MVVKCEPLVKMGHITRVPVPMNLAPAVVPELDDLTIDGLINGSGLEGSLHLLVLFSDNSIAYEINFRQWAGGSCNKDNKYSDLFYAIPWSQGTLGLHTRAEIKLTTIKEYMKLTYKPVKGDITDLSKVYLSILSHMILGVKATKRFRIL